jgi:chloramphenicol 3-O-phosphotransferase
MELIFIHGPPGVGKLTAGRELQKLTGYKLFHNHLTVDMVGAVFDFHSAAFAELRERFWLEVMVRAAREGVDGLIFTFVFEPTVLPGFYDRLAEQVTAAGASVHAVQLRCELEENARRLVRPDRAAFRKMMDPELLRGGVATGAYAAPEIPGNFLLDTTKIAAVEAARLIVERLKKAR